jgi:hypothetical protein
MTDTSLAHDQDSKRYPLSVTQEWFVTMDKGDDGVPFGRRYLIVSALRITGAVDLAVLQGALDDVVARHELLRTLVVRDADPPYQMVCPPCQVALEVRDLSPVTGKSRDMVFQELLLEAQAGTISAREVPLLRALLCRFDDRDSAIGEPGTSERVQGSASALSPRSASHCYRQSHAGPVTNARCGRTSARRRRRASAAPWRRNGRPVGFAFSVLVMHPVASFLCGVRASPAAPGGHGLSGRPPLSALPTVTPGLKRRISPIALPIPAPGPPARRTSTGPALIRRTAYPH